MKNINVNEQSLSEDLYKSFKKSYSEDTSNVILRHALNKNEIPSIVYDNKNEPNTNFVFSKEIKTLPVCNQKNSGRCWIFAGLNVLREIVAKKLNLKEFELSQNYVSLFDKLEKANYLLTSIIDLIDEEPNSRVLMHLLVNGVSDGGQWDMFRNIVKKYGVVPQSAFKETYQSEHTHASTSLINNYILNFAYEAQKLYKAKKLKEIPMLKEQYMGNIYNLLINSFGVPPTSFDFEYVDKDDKYHIEKGLTPKGFFDKYIGEEIDEYVSIINSPTKDKPFYKTYTINYLNNVVEGDIICHLNLPMERIKELVKAQIDDDSIVWFGSDVSFYGERKVGVWDDQSFDYNSAFNMDYAFDKAAMLDYHASVLNHAMCLTGYNLKEDTGVINRYKVENSWGTASGNNGFYLMSNTWFDAFVYQVVVKRKYLNNKELVALTKEVTYLDPWDPMGTLAD